jgi:hypothetical protein
MKTKTLIAAAVALVCVGSASAEVLFQIPWGSGSGQVGFYNQSKPDFDQPYAEGPAGIALGANGELWVSDQWNNRILCFGRDGKLVRALNKLGNEPIRRPKALWVDGNRELVVLNGETSSLLSYNLANGTVRKIGREGQGSGTLRQPELLGISSNEVCVQDDWRSELVCFQRDGKEVSRQQWPLGGLATDSQGRVFTLQHQPSTGGWTMISTKAGQRREHFAVRPPSGTSGLGEPAVVGVDGQGGAVVRWVKDGKFVLVKYDASGTASAPIGETATTVARQTFAVGTDGRVVALSFDATTAPRGGVQVLEFR